MNIEIEQMVKTMTSNSEIEKELTKHAERFYFFSMGKWISKPELIKKAFKGIRKEELEAVNENVSAILIALISLNKAISKTESDGVIRYKFTTEAKIHLEYLEREESMLVDRLKWVRSKIEEFKKEGS